MNELTDMQKIFLSAISGELIKKFSGPLSEIYAARNAALLTARGCGISDDFAKELIQMIMSKSEEIVAKAAEEALESRKD